MIEKKDAKGIFLHGHQSLSMVVQPEQRPRPHGLRTVDGKIHDVAVLGSADVDAAAVKDGGPPLSLLSLDGCSSQPHSRERRPTPVFARGPTIGRELRSSGEDDCRA
jgi:hypothetical protein